MALDIAGRRKRKLEDCNVSKLTDILSGSTSPRKRMKAEKEAAEQKMECHGGAGLLNCPGEIIDHIAQFLPRNSFLALRVTCTDLQQKTNYHFTRRHLKEKHFVLNFDKSRAGLIALVELASNASFAKRVQKVVIGMSFSCAPCAVYRSTPGSYRYNTGNLDWPAYFVDPPPQQWGNEGDLAVALSILFASLAALPALEVVELVDAPYHAEGTLLRARDSIPPRHAKPFVDLSWCNRCKKPSIFGQCIHKTILCRAVAHMTEFKVDILDDTHALGLSSLVQDITAAWPGHNGRRLQLRSLRKIYSCGENDSLYRYDRYYWSLWQDLIKYSPQLNDLSLNGSTIPASNTCVECWSLAHIPSGMLTSLSLHGLNICPDRLSALFEAKAASLHYVSLDGVMLTRTALTYRSVDMTFVLKVLARYGKKLEYIFVRAIFNRKNVPYVFGNEESANKLRAYLFHENEYTRDGNISVWRFNRPDMPGTDILRDTNGWQFEGEEVQAGLVFLHENGRLAPRNWF
ncbi:uncharacterized protein BDZ99DRAFT_470755 [Mytilinidion resinicola]|uniref:F-box domain-containing protein n=1 Tax=Mytilinidion resinicola TaxID=574789 RepID=A0A6A6Z9J9_9PEZI|nr:uncharacterized protein BDZ99DRAFT_470755 [Mytilinidion resinicola]KAF2817801.1 hypothetical protein BDZ99DRAFT_470755 [Mytilinidion resinicola]